MFFTRSKNEQQICEQMYMTWADIANDSDVNDMLKNTIC